MSDTLLGRLKKAWNVFSNKDPTLEYYEQGASYSYRPDRTTLSCGVDRTIVNSIINRIAIDVAAVNFREVQLDKNNRYISDCDSTLNECLSLEANVDQTSRAFIQDLVMSMFDEGYVAVVPVDTNKDPNKTESYDILSMRIGKILMWNPTHVQVELYNEKKGLKEQIFVRKSETAIIENPLYAVINQPNSTMKRLVRKLNLMDVVDDKNSSSKLDLIIQLPYIIKSEARKEQAEKRRKDIEEQLMNTKYGVAYTDGTEKITQLNRPVENQLLAQVESLTKLLFSQLGLTEDIMNGTATEQAMLNYYSRTIEPICAAIADEFKRKFLTKTARTQGKTIMYFRDPFKLVPTSQMAALADSFTRNEIFTTNEIRQFMGIKPSQDPEADQLRNKNLSQPAGIGTSEPPINEAPEEIPIGDLSINDL